MNFSTARIWDSNTGEPVSKPMRHSAKVKKAELILEKIKTFFRFCFCRGRQHIMSTPHCFAHPACPASPGGVTITK